MRITILTYLAASVCVIATGCQQSSDKAGSQADDSSRVVFFTTPVNDSVIADRKFEQVPAIAASEDGRTLFVAWYSGGEAPGPGNYVTVSTSSDNGESWINDQLVVYPKTPSTRVFDPALWRDKDGKVYLYYGTAGDSLLWDGFGGVNETELKVTGSGLKPGRSTRLTDGVMSNKPVYLSSLKAAFYPVYLDKHAADSSGRQYPEDGAFIFRKDASGFSRYSRITLPDSIRIHDEPQVVETDDKGAFLVLVRTTKGIYSASSTDQGKTWSEPKPFTSSGPTTSSRFYIGKLASGNLLLIANNSTTRNNMMASVSRDGGKTWPYQLMLDSRESVSYPDADQTPDGSIHVVFDRDRTGAKDILYCRFTEDDVLKGNTGGIVKKRVNK